ncbi:MAG: DNA helicase UvrD [Bacteroidetes bacterium]|nr:MAG: DNA helicase UvrD [Bacteroidota bacterium]
MEKAQKGLLSSENNHSKTIFLRLKIISAGAGSGKTYRLTSEMVALLKDGKVRPNGIIATTFTNKAAAELQERVRVRLLEEGYAREADELTNALIGTVHSLGVKLLKRFAFEAGVSPEVAIIADDDHQVLFNQSLSTVLTHDRVEKMEYLCDRLGLHKRQRYDWRRIVKSLTEVARTNDFDREVLEKSKRLSFESFRAFLPEPRPGIRMNAQTAAPLIEQTIEALKNSEDTTKITQTAIKTLTGLLQELRLRGELFWHQWVSISKLKTGAKSKDLVEDLKDFAQKHEQSPDFQEDIQCFIEQIFDIAIAAIREYDDYKKRRGLIDYTDMEVMIKRLLKNPAVQDVLSAELDLLLVDEFQDTSPIQLEIFLQLSRFAQYSIWVGDPKQSIYGFRGAEPALMQAIIEKAGGVRPEDIQKHSWRSREDIVFATNALFVKAFSDLPPEQVALIPKRRKKAGPDSITPADEPPEMGEALIHWHLKPDVPGKRLPGKPWMEDAIATTLRVFLDRAPLVLPKGERTYRPVRPGDVAILCKTNAQCQDMADALYRAGLKAAISRTGLLQTAEIKLILAGLKFILNKYDSLSIAEILLLAADLKVEEIIEDRLQYLETESPDHKWGEQNEFIGQLNRLREQVVELSSAEILNLLLEELDLRRIIVSWGKVEQRLANVDVLRQLALQYEEACNRLYTAASLGGFLLWLNDLEAEGRDYQGSGESPDAVQVLTYHKSKGLEWPVVICHSLEAPLKSDVWGIDIVPETAEVDLDNLLGNRWLRYWVNPYADQIKGTPLFERIEASNTKQARYQKALREEARLLYVGLTRARDYLIFPTRPTPAKWLNRVWHNGQEDYPTLSPDTCETPWVWDGHYLNAETEVFMYDKTFGQYEPPEEPVYFWEKRAGKQPHTPYFIDWRTENLPPGIAPKIGHPKNYASPFSLNDDTEKHIAGRVLNAWLLSDHPTLDPAERTESARALIERFSATDFLDSQALIRFSDAWFQTIENRFSPKNMHRGYPIRAHFEQRLFETTLDLLLETESGWVIIQHSPFAGDLARCKKKAAEAGLWFWLAKKSIQQLFNDASVHTEINFMLSGLTMEIAWKQKT